MQRSNAGAAHAGPNGDLPARACDLLLAGIFGFAIAVGAVWGLLVRAPDRPPLTHGSLPLYQGATGFTDQNGKPIGLAQPSPRFVNFKYSAPAAPEAVISFYDSTLKKMGFYLTDSSQPTVRSYVRQNDAGSVETLQISATPSEGGRTTVEVTLQAQTP